MFIFLFGLAFAGGCVVDYLLVKAKKKSISLRTWLAEKAHPTLIAGVFGAGLFIAYLAWDQMPVAMAVLITTGHLITTEGAAIAFVRTVRWKSSGLK